MHVQSAVRGNFPPPICFHIFGRTAAVWWRGRRAHDLPHSVSPEGISPIMFGVLPVIDSSVAGGRRCLLGILPTVYECNLPRGTTDPRYFFPRHLRVVHVDRAHAIARALRISSNSLFSLTFRCWWGCGEALAVNYFGVPAVRAPLLPFSARVYEELQRCLRFFSVYSSRCRRSRSSRPFRFPLSSPLFTVRVEKGR